MPRPRTPDRLASIVAAAIPPFVRAGIRRVQMDEVARALGVGKGTLYLYVSSKEALFDACLRSAAPSVGDEAPLDGSAPLPTPTEADTLGFVRQVARRECALPALEAPPAADEAGVVVQTEAMLTELYAMLERNGTLLRLVAGSAVDWPALGDVWYGETRDPVVRRIGQWISAREGRLRPDVDLHATARLVAETATWFAVHRRWDPRPDPLTDEDARRTALSALHHVLLRG